MPRGPPERGTKTTPFQHTYPEPSNTQRLHHHTYTTTVQGFVDSEPHVHSLIT